MGRPKIAIIDDSIPEEPASPAKRGEEVKKPQVPMKSSTHDSVGVKAEKKQKDSLIAQLNAELGIEEPVIPSEVEGSPADAGSPEKKSKKIATSPKAPRNDKEEKFRSKKYLEASKDLDRTQTYTIPEAVLQVKKNSYSKFPGSLEAHINTRFPNIKGLVSLPYLAGKKRTILAFGTGAKESGADLVGDDAILEEISKGKINFDILVVTPEWMPKLAKLAKILGPKGLMPNPKNNTVTTDLKKSIEGFQSGQTEYKTEPKASVMHLSLGKLSQPDSELESNVKLLLGTIGKSRIKKVTLTPTMGPSVKVNLNSL